MNRIISSYRFAAPAVRRQSAVTKIDLLKTKFVLKLAWLAIFIVLPSLFYVWSRVQIVQMGYEINHHKRIQDQLVEESKRYRMELAARQTPESLGLLVHEKFGMDLPDKKNIVTLKTSP